MRCAAAGAGARPRPGGVRRGEERRGGAAGPASFPPSSVPARPALTPIRRPAGPGGTRSHGAAEGGGARALPSGGGERQAPAAASRRCRGLGRRERETSSSKRSTDRRGRLGGRAAARPPQRGGGGGGAVRRAPVSRGLSAATRGRAGGRNGAAARPTHTVMRKRAWVSCVCVCYSTGGTAVVQKGAVAESAVRCIFFFRPLRFFFPVVVFGFCFFFNFLSVSEEDVIKITTGELFVLVTAMGMLPSALAEPEHTCGITLTSK